MTYPLFDGHNDLLLRLMQRGKKEPVSQSIAQCVSGDSRGHIDLPRMKKGGFTGGLFTIFIPPVIDNLNFESMGDGGYAIPMPEPMPYQDALPVAMEQVSILLQLIENSHGAMRLCTSRADIDRCVSDEVVAVVLHMEGAEAIDEQLMALDLFYAAGLRSLGPVWSRNTVFADGVPLSFPATPDIGGGLTEAGKRLIKACNEKRILIDLSHINYAGFYDIAKLSTAPLVASHSNAWSVCNSARNLTDDQLGAIKASNGLVGVNLATCFIRADGKMTSKTTLDELLVHVDYLLDKLGETRVGLGSDFDGAVVPEAIGDIGGLDVLRDALARRGYDEVLQRKLCMENWLNVLERTWGH